ncbi:uncharacterized protein METZ01_LOCUS512684 [marine metagenome]|uniref:Uncharacterized protein n=1 Tax=marine metagenome TaxID=408172 RepID=A0A383EU23_9ZZZZ
MRKGRKRYYCAYRGGSISSTMIKKITITILSLLIFITTSVAYACDFKIGQFGDPKEKIKIDPPPVFFSDEFGGHTIVIPTEEICRDEVNLLGTVVMNLYIDNKLSQIRLERGNMNDRNLMDFAMKKYGSFRLPQEIDKMNWRGTHRWENDSEYIVYVVSNIQNGSIEIIEITSKLYANDVAAYYNKFAKELE